MKSTGRLFTSALGVAVGVLFARWQLQRLFTEEPAYDVESRDGDFEVRSYGPTVRASTTVEATDWDAALQIGFRRLAGYIFGGNHPLEGVAATPQPRAGSERLSMTAPVTLTAGSAPTFTMTFTLPAGRPLASFPVPNDSSVELTEVPSHRVVVLRFSGTYRADRVKAKVTELTNEAARRGLLTTETPLFAGYDPPSTLPFLRRNEVWLTLAPESV